MNSKQEKVYEAVFKNPIQSNIEWQDIENLLKSLGAKITEGKASRVRIELNGQRAVFHRSHPESVTDKGAVKSIRRFLDNAGVRNDEVEREFRASIDDYLECCKEDGVEPEKPYSGKFNVRLSPFFHSQVAIAAKKLNLSLNSFVEKSLRDEINAMQLQN